MHASFRLILVAVAIAACSGVDRSLLNLPDVAPAATDAESDLGSSPDGGQSDVPAPIDVPGPQDTAPEVAVDTGPACGDGICNGAETCATCPADCVCGPTCGDRVCNNGETCASCPMDCGACPRCGDRVCNNGETCATCPMDCGACDPCGAMGTTCGTCTPQNNCGWCRNVNRCLTGTRTGPNNAACGTAEWAWQTNECPAPSDPCTATTDCATCADMAACGWCRNLGRCLTGTTAGPNNRACTAVQWVPTRALCPRMGGG